MITMYELIEKTKHGAELSAEEINWFVAGYVSGSIPIIRLRRGSWRYAFLLYRTKKRPTSQWQWRARAI